MITEGFGQIAFHATRIGRLVTISGPQLAIVVRQQPDRLAEQEDRRRHGLFTQPRRIGIPIGLAFLPADVAGLHAGRGAGHRPAKG